MQINANLGAVCAAALMSTAVGSMAEAQTFDVKGSDIEKGQTSVEMNNTLFNGYPINADRVRSSHELSIGHGLTDWLKVGAKANFDKPLDSDFQLSTAAIEAQIMLRKFENGFGLAWFTETAFAIHRDETNSVTFGPILQFGTEKTQLLVNPFFTRTFGQNREEGVEFSYAWAVKQEVQEGFSVGIEGYGSIPNIGDPPSGRFQPHRIGPVIYLERSLGGNGNGGGRRMSVKDVGGGEKNGESGPKLGMEFGVLLGMTEGTQDVAFKLKAGIEF